MKRTVAQLTIDNLRKQFFDIDFPEYQREPDIWSRDQKQRLIDSVLRRFDIASIYLYLRDNGAVECIDGRQRLNAIMSFLASNVADERDDGFPLRLHNEISSDDDNRFVSLDSRTFSDLTKDTGALAKEAVATILEYPVTVVYLSEAIETDEFNLQFLRLNLGTLINAGEKLHAMVGKMRDLLFVAENVGLHPFFDGVKIPTRRYAKELSAAQVLLQIFAKHEHSEFARARHFDLQRFVKQHADVGDNDPRVVELTKTLDVLQAATSNVSALLRNRAITISVVLLAWDEALFDNPAKLPKFEEFLQQFLGRLRWQVQNMKDFKVEPLFAYLVDFQRNLTQAAVEKPAVTQRHALLKREWDQWLSDGALTGDAAYETKYGSKPPVKA
jgi:hypothetical protein